MTNPVPSRDTVRQAIASWITAGAITNLNQVLATVPKLLDFNANSQAGQASRGACLVFIVNENESTVSGGVYGGWRRMDYAIGLQVEMYTTQPDEATVMLDYDTLIDAVKARLRGGGFRLNLPDGTVIWQAAQKGISVNYGLPDTDDDGISMIEATITFSVTQMIQV